VDFVEICNVYTVKTIIKAAKRIFNSGKICRSYSDLNFGVTFLKHSVLYIRFEREVIAAYCLNFGHCFFEPSLRGLGATHAVHLRLIRTRAVDTY